MVGILLLGLYSAGVFDSDSNNGLAADQPESGTRNTYSASAIHDPTNGNGNPLIDLWFSYAEIKIEVGDNVFDCGFDADDACLIVEETDDGVWGANEHITLKESSDDNIVVAEGASVNIYIKYRNAMVSGTDNVEILD